MQNRQSSAYGQAESPQAGDQMGEIVRLVRDRGFGFIRFADGREIFFHASGMVGVPFDDLQEGQQVTFRVAQDERGRGERAVGVQPA
jgi:cold shock CspA family protein